MVLSNVSYCICLGGRAACIHSFQACTQPSPTSAAIAPHAHAGGNWIRIPAIMYGIHAATSTIPMLAEYAYGAGAKNPHKTTLLAIYGCYCAFPLIIALSMAMTRIPFPADKKKKLA